MKILLIDNRTKHLRKIKHGLQDHELTVIEYRPGLQLSGDGYEMVILTGGGGEGREVNDTYRGRLWYEDQMKFVLNCDKPILGICMGFEVIARAYGEKIEKMRKRIRNFQMLQPHGKGKRLFGTQSIRQFESHEWRLPEIKSGRLEKLVDSQWGVEAFHHVDRPILATQFHPEVEGGSHSISDLVNHTLSLKK